jgi:putative membrane protein
MVQNQTATPTQPGLSWLKGACAGFAGTLPMTIFMLLTQRFLPHRQRYDLPPEIITKELAHRAHVRYHMNKVGILGATLVSHFGYGAAMGALYSPLAKRLPLPSVVKGAIFGLFIWAASYLGLLPLIGVSESGHREPGRRNLMMIAAHAVWGSSMGLVADLLLHR